MSRLIIENLSFRDRGPYCFEIDGGECLGMQGASGAGKTLLLRAIVDLDPHMGNLRLDDMECAHVSPPVWRKNVAMLPAESCWWLDVVGDHFHDFVTVSTKWLAELGFSQDVADWQVSRLSTGEKQRLAILRMLENKPQALLLDEPTASLDRVNSEGVERLLVEYGRINNAPLLWVSHDPEQLDRVAGRCLFMQADGSLEPFGGA